MTGRRQPLNILDPKVLDWAATQGMRFAQPRRGSVGARATTVKSTHTRAPHTRKVNGRQVAVRRSKPIQTARQLNEGLADASRRVLAHWQATRAEGPGRVSYARHVAAGAGAVTAIAVGQVASGVTAVAAGVLVVVASLLLAAFFPQKTRKRWKKRAKRVRAWFRPHVQRGRKVAAKTRAKTQPRKRAA